MKADTRSFYETAVQRAAAQIAGDLDRALDLQALARLVHLSPFHFHRIFRGLVGETPVELHRRLRLERAAWQLLHTDAPVTTIAFDAGYETHKSFTRAFRGHYDCSPTQFRHSRVHAAGCERPFQVERPARCGLHFTSAGPKAVELSFLHGDTAMQVSIEQQPEIRVATMPHTGPYNRISEAFAQLGEAAARSGLFGPATAMIAIYHDDPETTPPEDLHSEAAIRVTNDQKIPASLGERRIPAGSYARARHIGPYERLGDTWSRLLGDWLPASGRRMADGVAYELYVNDPRSVPKEQLVTDLYIPLAP